LIAFARKFERCFKEAKYIDIALVAGTGHYGSCGDYKHGRESKMRKD